MQEDIHPKYEPLSVKCSCGESFETASTLGKDSLNIETCSKCHPAYTKIEGKKEDASRAKLFAEKYKKSGAPAKQAAEETKEEKS